MSIKAIDINDYRHSKGTKGNYSILNLSISRNAEDIFLDYEKVGVYDNSQMMLNIIREDMESYTKLNYEVLNYILRIKKNVLELTFSFKNPDGGDVNNIIYRIYPLNAEDFKTLKSELEH
jgi:hypothetical protein